MSYTSFFFLLPLEIVQVIASHLDQQSLTQCSLVCNAWHSIFEPSLWRSVVPRPPFRFDRFRFDNPSPSLEALTRNLHHIRQLKTSDPALVRLFASHKSEFAQLQSLDLYLHAEVVSPFSYPSESDLALRNASAVMRVLEGCSSLRSLSLGGWNCFKHADETDAFQEIISACPSRSLQSLTVHIRDEDPGPCIQRASWHSDANYDQEYQSAVAQQQQLPSFMNLREVCIMASVVHIHPPKLSFFARCPNLVRVELQSMDECVVKLLGDTFQAFCSSLAELVWTSGYIYGDKNTAAMLSSSRTGWKVLAMHCHVQFGRLSYDAVMRSAEKLEELDLVMRGYGTKKARRDFFLDLVCVLKNLRRLTGRDDGERGIDETGVEIHAADAFRQHIEGGGSRTWALGPSMKELHMQVVGVPRPDVLCRYNGTPLRPWMVEVLDNSRRYEVQRWVYEQLGRMVGLEELVLGVVDICLEDVGDFMPEEDVDMTAVENLTALEDAMEEDDWLHRLINYQCLEFSLESGLELLEGLKELRVLDVKSTAHRIGVAELEWMHVNWPKLKEIKGLVVERNWVGDAEDALAVKAAVEEWLAAHPQGIGSSFYAGLSST